MTVHCPHCSTGYLLPDHLLGPRGARVRCPQCRRPFVVLRETQGEAVAGPPLSSPAAATAETPEGSRPLPGAGDDSTAIAARLLDALAARLGEALVQAQARGRVLAEFGPEVMEAYDQYRGQLGGRADTGAFRVALRQRLGVDLTSGLELTPE